MAKRGPARDSSPNQKSRERSSSKTPVLYITIVSLVVFSMLCAGLSMVDWGALFNRSPEPTPDYNFSAISVQQTIVAQNPDDLEALALLASMLATSGRMPEAIPLYEKALERNPADAATRLDFARNLQANGLSADAEAQFLKVLELDANNHTAHYYLARLYLDATPRRRDEAISHLRRVIEIAPNSFLAEQARNLLATLQGGTPTQYEETPISSPTGSG